MAKKDVVEYFNQVADQYQEMLDNIKEIEQDVNTTLTDPELVERLKKAAEPVKNNFMTLSYIMFLLNKPQRKEKEKKYVKMNKKLLQSIDPAYTKDGIMAENRKTIENIKKGV